MSFSQEIKDFIGGVDAVNRWFPKETAHEKELKALASAQDSAETSAGGLDAGTRRTASTDAPSTGTSTGVIPSFVQSDLLSRTKKAITGIESGGNYGAVGPTHPRYGRALGVAQVMEANLPQWSQEALGRMVTADEFLKNPKVQDAIVDHRLAGYLKQNGGDPADAASRWHSGQPLAKAGGRRDSLGTKTTDYAARVAKQVYGTNPGWGKRAALELDDSTVPTQFAAEGGLIRDPEEVETIPAPGWVDPLVAPPAAVQAQGVIPVAPERPTDAALRTAPVTPASKPAAPRPARRAAIPDNGAQLPGEGMSEANPYGEARDTQKPLPVPQEGLMAAIQSGLDDITKAFGLHGGGERGAALPQATEGRQAGIARLARNEGAATPEEVRAVDQTIDPEGRMSPDARALRRLYGGYDFYVKRGEPEKAAKFAKSMLLYTRGHMQAGGSLAEQHLKEGDVPGAAKVIARAHNEFPDGQSLKITGSNEKGASYAVYDENGDLTSQGEANVDQLMKLATGMRNGTEWYRQLGLIKNRAPQLTAAQALKEKTRLQDEEARADYDAAGAPETEAFLSGLSPEARTAYDKMSAKGKAFTRREAMKAMQAQDKVDGQDAKAVGKGVRGQDEQDYAGHVATITQAQAALTRAQANPSDTAGIAVAQTALEDARSKALEWTGAGPDRAKFADRLSRVGGGAGRTAGTRATKAVDPNVNPGKTEGERADWEAERQARATRDAEMAPGVVTQAGSANIQAAQVDAAFKKAARQGDAPDAAVLDETIRAKVPKAEGSQLYAMRAAAGAIAQANGMQPDEAVDMVRLAIAAGPQLKVDNAGRVQFGSAPPVFISRDGLAAIRRLQPRQAVGAPPAPGKVQPAANPFGATGVLPDDVKAQLDARLQRNRGQAPMPTLNADEMGIPF